MAVSWQPVQHGGPGPTMTYKCVMSNAEQTVPALPIPAGADVSVWTLGTFGGSFAVAWQGSPDNSTFVQLNDSRGQGNAISSLTANAVRQVLEACNYIKPVGSSFDSSTSVVHWVIIKYPGK